MSKNILPFSFYNRQTTRVARELLGKLLVRKIGETILSGIIIETEAYLPFEDPAAHSFRGKDSRNEVLFGPAGRTYVHRIHRYHCLDITTEEGETPGSVLIRALQPFQGLETMQRNRNTSDIKNIASGPGRLCQAMQITMQDKAIDVTSLDSSIYILNFEEINQEKIITTPRIGITKAAHLPLRFLFKD